MQTLYADDMISIDYDWMIERVHRCYEQIRQVSEQILAIGNHVILDLGFTTKEQRDIFANRAKQMGLNPEVHYLNVPKEIRKKRVEQRNIEKDPAVYALEVTDMMFEFMEPKFEIPDEHELSHGCVISP